AHLILAEVAIAAGNFAEAKAQMRRAIAAALRPDSVVGFNSTNTRPNVPAVGGFRPRSADLLVRADATSPAIPGLIRTRPGLINVYPTSFTSLRASDIDALPDNEEELVRTLFLLRQEIFFLEGRRICDLGMRLPLWRRQLDVNPIGTGPGFDLPVIPTYIPGFANINPGTHDMDAFTVSGNIVTCGVDMNRVIARNRAYPLRRP
ncbi:MAG: tetratricopeptide repeat protein, partial [Chloroherpetonaceae bacterium]|nr:tetratricopeptide repeat protein [Chloroherpetonaceae bacterium]